jgi:hypothetical protein
MADIKSCTEGVIWRLRASQPVPVIGCLGDQTKLRYLIQSFGAEQRVTKSYKATTQILTSEDFIGINTEAEFESASYSATQYITLDGEVVFAGQEKKRPTYVNEDDMPGVSGFYL